MKEKDMSYFECFAGGNFILHKPLISDERSAGCLVGYFFNSPSPSSNVCMYFFFLYALRMQKSLECKSSTLQYAKRSKFKKLSHFVTEENSSTFAQRRKVDYYQVLLYIAYKWENYITAVQIVTCTRIVIIISYFLKTYRICLFK